MPPEVFIEKQFVIELTAHQSELHAFITALMPGDPEIDEVLQRTNVTLWRKRANFTPDTNFQAWAFECAKWTIRAYFKEKKRKNWLIFDEKLTNVVSHQISMHPSSPPSASQNALQHCLSKLRDIDRELILSYYEHNKTLAKHSPEHERTTGTLKTTLYRLRSALRRCISQHLAQERNEL